jgi:prepilin-type N-terminal cleavage/methylation domain-containing protein
MRNQRGFTLIELLVVIAIVGVLSGVVLVAINPQRRIQEANDANLRSGVGQVATALEACYTNEGGAYTAGVCDSVANLVTAAYLKLAPAGVTVDANTDNTQAVAYATMNVQVGCAVGETRYIRYLTSTGATDEPCLAAVPDLP